MGERTMADATTGRTGTEHGPERHETRVPIGGDAPLELVIHNPNGDVIVRRGVGPDVLIRHAKHGRPGTRRFDEARIETEVRDARIEIRPRFGSGAAGDGWATGGGAWATVGAVVSAFTRGGEGAAVHVGLGGDEVRYDIEVELPRGAPVGRVEVRTASGDVDLADIVADVSVATASGDVRMRGVGGDLSVHTASGDATMAGATGRLTVRTASGDLRVEGARLDAFAVASVSGDARVEAALTGAGPYRVESVSSDTGLGLGLGPGGATVAFQTVSGDAAVEPPFRATARRAWQVGDGATRVAVKSVSGDLRAWVAGVDPTPDGDPAAAEAVPTPPDPAAPPTAPTPPAPPTPPVPLAPMVPPVLPVPAVAPIEDAAAAPLDPSTGDAAATEAARLAVLRAVEQGEIGVEEALGRLEGLGDLGARPASSAARPRIGSDPPGDGPG